MHSRQSERNAVSNGKCGIDIGWPFLAPIAGGATGLIAGGVGGAILGCFSAFLITIIYITATPDKAAVQQGDNLRTLETEQVNAGDERSNSNKLVKFLIRLFSARSDS